MKEIDNNEIEDWPQQLERIAEELTKKHGLSLDETISMTDYKKYVDKCIPWEEYRKEWMK